MEQHLSDTSRDPACGSAAFEGRGARRMQHMQHSHFLGGCTRNDAEQRARGGESKSRVRYSLPPLPPLQPASDEASSATYRVPLTVVVCRSSRRAPSRDIGLGFDYLSSRTGWLPLDARSRGRALTLLRLRVQEKASRAAGDTLLLVYWRAIPAARQ